MQEVAQTLDEEMERVREAFALQANPASSPAQMKEALSWLEKFQNTQEAWQVADQLLAQPAPNGGNGVQPEHIFAAQTMRTKIQYDWAELPAEAHASLRSSLLAHVLPRLRESWTLDVLIDVTCAPCCTNAIPPTAQPDPNSTARQSVSRE